MMEEAFYSWNGREYPYFFIEPDRMAPGCWIVCLHFTCYPYAYGSEWNGQAFPSSLFDLGYEGNTKFWFLARGDDGVLLEGLDEESARNWADYLNERFSDSLDDAIENYNWRLCPFDVIQDDLFYWK